jgi:tRNA U34 5-methylaminomethyl-2-thiouridine-forming methyltransferase MnmC
LRPQQPVFEEGSSRAVRTADGSFSFWSDRYAQHYHSTHGAVTESEHVFFKTPDVEGFARANHRINVFEAGFGTGTNFFLAAGHAQKTDSALTFMSVEKYPLTPQDIRFVTANRFEDVCVNMVSGLFENLQEGWNTVSTERVILHLFYGDFYRIESIPAPPDFLFHDAFSPEVNPELWDVRVFEMLKAWSAPHVKLTTYAASVRARAAMAAAGWHIGRASGAPGKREMTIAALDPAQLSGFKRLDQARLAERWHSGEWTQERPGS